MRKGSVVSYKCCCRLLVWTSASSVLSVAASINGGSGVTEGEVIREYTLGSAPGEESQLHSVGLKSASSFPSLKICIQSINRTFLMILYTLKN